MPKVQWTGLPEPIRKHLLLRLKDRSITEEDLYKLKLWRESEPDAPDGPWYKDFGTFKICGEGKYPKTFLLKGQAATGEELQAYGRVAMLTVRHGASRVERPWLGADAASS